MKYTIHYIPQEDSTYTRETRNHEGLVIGKLTQIVPADIDSILDTTSPFYDSVGQFETKKIPYLAPRMGLSLREMLEWDAEYIEWLSQMCTPEEDDYAVTAIRKIIPYEVPQPEPRVYE